MWSRLSGFEGSGESMVGLKIGPLRCFLLGGLLLPFSLVTGWWTSSMFGPTVSCRVRLWVVLLLWRKHPIRLGACSSPSSDQRLFSHAPLGSHRSSGSRQWTSRLHLRFPRAASFLSRAMVVRTCDPLPLSAHVKPVSSE